MMNAYAYGYGKVLKVRIERGTSKTRPRVIIEDGRGADIAILYQDDMDKLAKAWQKERARPARTAKAKEQR